MITTEQRANCQAVEDTIKRLSIERLTKDIESQAGQFVYLRDFDEPALNSATIAEWAWGLLERQREALTAAVLRALDENDKDTK